MTDARNLKSIALLERLGFGAEASTQTVFKGAPCVEWSYVLGRADWQASRASSRLLKKAAT